MVIRDHGYWAFYLLSCYYFILLYKHPNLKNSSALIVTTTLAALFKVEGLVFSLLLPLLLFIHHISLLKKPTIIFTFLSLFVITSASFLSYNNGYDIPSIRGFEKTHQIEQAIKAPITKTSSAINTTETYLNKLSSEGFSNEYAPTVLGFFFILILFTEIFSATSPLYAIALGFALFKTKMRCEHSLTRVWVYLVLINILILCGFLVSKYFIAGRYPIALALTLITPLPFLIQLIYQKFQDNDLNLIQNKIAKAAAILFVVLSIDGVVSTGASKVYLKNAGEWVASSQQEQKRSFFTNSQFVSFYAGNQNANE